MITHQLVNSMSHQVHPKIPNIGIISKSYRFGLPLPTHNDKNSMQKKVFAVWIILQHEKKMGDKKMISI